MLAGMLSRYEAGTLADSPNDSPNGTTGEIINEKKWTPIAISIIVVVAYFVFKKLKR